MAGPTKSKTWAICCRELKDPLGKPLFATSSAARKFASRMGMSTGKLNWTFEEMDFLYKHQDLPVSHVKRKLNDELGKVVTLEQIRYKRKKMKMKNFLAGENAGSSSVPLPSGPASAGENAGSSSVSLPPRSPALMHSGATAAAAAAAADESACPQAWPAAWPGLASRPTVDRPRPPSSGRRLGKMPQHPQYK